ncbi:MAG TPA: POTRA domain-containing protein [Stenotrophomonas sp.]|jgi:hemolysin activation/secretion protein
MARSIERRNRGWLSAARRVIQRVAASHALLLVSIVPIASAQSNLLGPGAATAGRSLHSSSALSASADPRIPSEPDCARIIRLSILGEAAAHYRWALRYADRHDDRVSGRCIGRQGRQIALQRLQRVIVARGYVTTRVVMSADEPRHGTLNFTVVPGRVGHVQFVPEIDRRASLRDTVALRRGALLNLRAIEQALSEMQARRMADADIRILPAAGSGSPRGESDLLIVWQPTAVRVIDGSLAAAAYPFGLPRAKIHPQEKVLPPRP